MRTTNRGFAMLLLAVVSGGACSHDVLPPREERPSYPCTFVNAAQSGSNDEVLCGKVRQRIGSATAEYLRSGKKVWMSAPALLRPTDVAAFMESALQKLNQQSTHVSREDESLIGGKKILAESNSLNVDVENDQIIVVVGNESYSIIADGDLHSPALRYIIH